MSERKMKRVADSMTEQSHLLMPKCLNAAGYLFGGQLLAWIDETAGIVAKRHAEMNVVTVAVDNMYFKTGARVDDTIVLIGRLTHVGRSSMEIRIDTYAESLKRCADNDQSRIFCHGRHGRSSASTGSAGTDRGRRDAADRMGGRTEACRASKSTKTGRILKKRNEKSGISETAA